MSECNNTLRSDHLAIYLEVAQEALKKYAIEHPATARLINYSENYTYLVEGLNHPIRTILRITSPGYHSKQEIEAEISYLNNILEKSIIEVPEPVIGLNGEHIQEITVDNLDNPYYCVMFSFLTGETPNEENERELILHFEKLGEITALLHNHSQELNASYSINRPIWNYETTLGSKANWGRWENGVAITPERKMLFQKASETIKSRLTKFSAASNRFGLIHGDLRLANLLIEDRTMKVLDFDDCGYSWYLYDLGAALSFIEHKEYVPDLIKAWVTGYKKKRSISQEEEAEIPTFIMLRRLVLVGWVGSRIDTDLSKSLGAEYTDQTVEMAKKYLSHFGH